MQVHAVCISGPNIRSSTHQVLTVMWDFVHLPPCSKGRCLIFYVFYVWMLYNFVLFKEPIYGLHLILSCFLFFLTLIPFSVLILLLNSAMSYFYVFFVLPPPPDFLNTLLYFFPACTCFCLFNKISEISACSFLAFSFFPFSTFYNLSHYVTIKRSWRQLSHFYLFKFLVSLRWKNSSVNKHHET